MIKGLSIFSGIGIGTYLAVDNAHKNSKPVFRPFTILRNYIDNLILQIDRLQVSYKPSFFDYYSSLLNTHLIFITSNLTSEVKENFKDCFSFKIIEFNEKAEGVKDNIIALNGLLLAIVDSQMGLTSALWFNKKPVVTAHLEMNIEEKIEINRKYMSVVQIKSEDKRSVWLQATMLDDVGKIVSVINSRFVKLENNPM